VAGIDHVFSGVPGVDAGDKKSLSPGLNGVSLYFSGMNVWGRKVLRLLRRASVRSGFRLRAQTPAKRLKLNGVSLYFSGMT